MALPGYVEREISQEPPDRNGDLEIDRGQLTVLISNRRSRQLILPGYSCLLKSLRYVGSGRPDLPECEEPDAIAPDPRQLILLDVPTRKDLEAAKFVENLRPDSWPDRLFRFLETGEKLPKTTITPPTFLLKGVFVMGNKILAVDRIGVFRGFGDDRPQFDINFNILNDALRVAEWKVVDAGFNKVRTGDFAYTVVGQPFPLGWQLGDMAEVFQKRDKILRGEHLQAVPSNNGIS